MVLFRGLITKNIGFIIASYNYDYFICAILYFFGNRIYKEEARDRL